MRWLRPHTSQLLLNFFCEFHFIFVCVLAILRSGYFFYLKFFKKVLFISEIVLI